MFLFQGNFYGFFSRPFHNSEINISIFWKLVIRLSFVALWFLVLLFFHAWIRMFGRPYLAARYSYNGYIFHVCSSLESLMSTIKGKALRLINTTELPIEIIWSPHGGGGRTWINFCWVCAAATQNLCLGKCNFCDPKLVTFCSCIFLIKWIDTFVYLNV